MVLAASRSRLSLLSNVFYIPARRPIDATAGGPAVNAALSRPAGILVAYRP